MNGPVPQKKVATAKALAALTGYAGSQKISEQLAKALAFTGPDLAKAFGLSRSKPSSPRYVDREAEDRRAALIIKLERHIQFCKQTGKGRFTSKIAFYTHLRIDKADYYRWERGEKPRARGYSERIESAIEQLPRV